MWEDSLLFFPLFFVPFHSYFYKRPFVEISKNVIFVYMHGPTQSAIDCEVEQIWRLVIH